MYIDKYIDKYLSGQAVMNLTQNELEVIAQVGQDSQVFSWLDTVFISLWEMRETKN